VRSRCRLARSSWWVSTSLTRLDGPAGARAAGPPPTALLFEGGDHRRHHDCSLPRGTARHGGGDKAVNPDTARPGADRAQAPHQRAQASVRRQWQAAVNSIADSQNLRLRVFAQDCVVGLGGLELLTKRLLPRHASEPGLASLIYRRSGRGSCTRCANRDFPVQCE
jgi:hypothetical protein